VHYYPTFGSKENFDQRAKVDAIPPQWAEVPTVKHEIPLQMHGTTMEEPTCPNYWCNTEFSKKWSGPGEDGYILDPNGEKRVLDVSTIDCMDKDHRCTEWAQWETEECEKNKAYMEDNCPRSCGLCKFSMNGGSDEL
jgi:hypothetical protein